MQKSTSGIGTLADVGEFGLIEIISRSAIIDDSKVIKGIGDDCAVVVPVANDCVELLTTDMLVEDVHFLRTTTAEDIGYKAIACNVSDIAAMGGKPLHCLISLAAPKDASTDWILELYAGMRAACAEYGVNIVGGDTVSSNQGFIINIALTGEVPRGETLLRSGARPGDWICVTGVPGSSAVGLHCILTGVQREREESLFIEKHCRPKARVLAGQILRTCGASAANDISDGVASELNEIAYASGVRIEIESELMPVPKVSARLGESLTQTALELALYGGEDYELLFTISETAGAALEKSELDDWHVIGRVCAGQPGVFLKNSAGQMEKIESRGYNHFGN